MPQTSARNTYIDHPLQSTFGYIVSWEFESDQSLSQILQYHAVPRGLGYMIDDFPIVMHRIVRFYKGFRRTRYIRRCNLTG